MNYHRYFPLPTSSCRIGKVLLLLGWLTSCTASAPHSSASGSISEVVVTGAAKTRSSATLTESREAGAPQPSTPRRMVYNADVRLRVTRSDTAQARVRRLVAREQGYLVQTSEEQMQLRIPAERLLVVLQALPGIGKVESQNLRGQDVTEEYTDYQIRLENAQKARQRYLELLAKAANVTEAVAVEKELQRLNTEIDQFTGQLQRLQHLTTYATLTIALRPKTRLGPLGYVSVGVYKAVRWLFVWGKNDA